METNILNVYTHPQGCAYETYVSMGNSKEEIDVSALIQRIKEAYDLDSNADVARHLGLKERGNPIEQAIRTGKINIRRVVEHCPDVNQNWLLYGRGLMRAEEGGAVVGEPTAKWYDQPLFQQRFLVLDLETGKVISQEEARDLMEEKEEEKRKKKGE